MLLASVLDSFESNRDYFWVVVPCLVIICLTYTLMMFFFIYLQTNNETLVHFTNRTCPNGENCKFKNRYKKARMKRKFGKILNKNESKKAANLYFRITETLLGKKNQKEKVKIVEREECVKDAKCFICCKKPPGFAFLPCLHTGVCIGCGIDSLDPKNQRYNGNVLRCPMCRKTPKNVFFYKESQSGELEGLGIKDLKSVLGMKQEDFEKIFKV